MVGASATLWLMDLRRAMRSHKVIKIADEPLTITYIKIEDLENWNGYRSLEASIGARRLGEAEEIVLTGIVPQSNRQKVAIDWRWKKLARTS